MQKHEYKIHKSFLETPKAKSIPAPSNELAIKIYTLEKALNRAMTTLHDIRNTLACPPDVDYADLAAEYAAEAENEVYKILEVK